MHMECRKQRNKHWWTDADGAHPGLCRRLQNVFIIGKDDKPLISLPKGKGVRLDILQEQAKRDAAKA